MSKSTEMKFISSATITKQLLDKTTETLNTCKIPVPPKDYIVNTLKVSVNKDDVSYAVSMLVKYVDSIKLTKEEQHIRYTLITELHDVIVSHFNLEKVATLGEGTLKGEVIVNDDLVKVIYTYIEQDWKAIVDSFFDKGRELIIKVPVNYGLYNDVPKQALLLESAVSSYITNVDMVSNTEEHIKTLLGDKMNETQYQEMSDYAIMVFITCDTLMLPRFDAERIKSTRSVVKDNYIEIGIVFNE